MVFCGCIMYTQPWFLGYNRPYYTETLMKLEFTPFRLCHSNSSIGLLTCEHWSVRDRHLPTLDEPVVSSML